MEETPKFDARLKEGVAYFEQMLKVMPDDRTTLEFLAVAYPQMGELDKAENAVASLARVLLKEGDVESATALLPRLEECEAPAAKAMVLKVRAAISPRPELTPEAPSAAPAGLVAAAAEIEAKLAAELGEEATAEQLRALPDNGRLFLVSALSLLEKENPPGCEKALAALADKYGEPPVPLDAFEPDKQLLAKLADELVRVRGVIPFARLGDLALVATLSPHDAVLKKAVRDALGERTVFFLAEPRLVEQALQKIHPETKDKNA